MLTSSTGSVGIWDELLEAYSAWLIAGGTRPGSVKLRMHQLGRFARAIKMNPDRVTLDDVTDYFANQRWSPATLRSNRSALRGFYRWARATQRLENDPTRMLRRIPARETRRLPASESTVREGLTHVDARIRLMVRLGAEVGLRCCEIAVVHSRDVLDDLVGCSLLVHGKGGKQRLVPIEPDLATRIRAAEGYLFPGRIDGHLSSAYVSKLLSRALGEATAHQLRHRFGTVSYTFGGNDLRAVQELLGHASVATTQIYVTVDDQARRRAARAAVLGGVRAVRPAQPIAS